MSIREVLTKYYKLCYKFYQTRTIIMCDYKNREKVKCQLQSFKNMYKSSNEACIYATGTIWYVGNGVCHGVIFFWQAYNVDVFYWSLLLATPVVKLNIL